MPSRLLDVLETEGGWWSIPELHSEYVLRFGAADIRSVQRTVAELRRDGLVESRVEEVVTKRSVIQRVVLRWGGNE